MVSIYDCVGLLFFSANLECSRHPREEIYVSSTCLGNDQRRMDIFGCGNISGSDKISNYSNICLVHLIDVEINESHLFN